MFTSVSQPVERRISYWQNRLAQVAIAGIANDANNLKPLPAHIPRRAFERSSQRILMAEILPYERPVDDRRAGRQVTRAKISAADQRNLHGIQPAGRDIHKPGAIFSGSRAIDRDCVDLEAVPSLSSGQSAYATVSTPGTLRRRSAT